MTSGTKAFTCIRTRGPRAPGAPGLPGPRQPGARSPRGDLHKKGDLPGGLPGSHFHDKHALGTLSDPGGGPGVAPGREPRAGDGARAGPRGAGSPGNLGVSGAWVPTPTRLQELYKGIRGYRGPTASEAPGAPGP